MNRKRSLIVGVTVLFSVVFFLLSRRSSEPIVEGKPMSLWFKRINIPSSYSLLGSRPPSLTLNPEVRAFLIQQLKNHGSALAAAYRRIWFKVPDRCRGLLPEPVSYEGRRMNAVFIAHESVPLTAAQI